MQEALTNVVKHAGASRVASRSSERRRTAWWSPSSDDGRGFDPGASTGGFGLAGMRERVALVGGELDIDSGPTGTTIRARLPVRRRATVDA